jgi:hypothetical protein
MSAELYNKLRKLDTGMAAVYKKAVGGKFTGIISRKEADAIFAKAIDGKTITRKEAEALNEIIKRGRFASDVSDHLIRKIKSKKGKAALIAGTEQWLFEDHELKPVRAALGMANVRKICFHSPGTKLSYKPLYYQGVSNLIEDGDIYVFRMHASGLNKTAGLGSGSYARKSNELRIYSGLSTKAFTEMVIHESTHAIQDLMDIRSQVKFVEADAYVAHAVTTRQLKRNLNKESDHPHNVAFHGAAKLVWDGKASGQKWKSAYGDVVDAVAAHDLYAHKQNKGRQYKETGESEKAILRSILRSLKKKKKNKL